MTRKTKLFLFLFIFLILFIFASINVENKTSNPIIQSIKSAIPEKVKIVLKKTLFHIPTLNNEVQNNTNELNKLKTTIEELNQKMDYLTNEFNLPILESKNIKSELNKYNITSYKIPFLQHSKWAGKPVAYLEQTDTKVIIGSGSGEFFYFNKNEIGSDKLIIKKINSNIKDLIKNRDFYLPGRIGIRDLLIIDNKIFFSFLKEQTSGCYNTSIMVSDINLNYLNFSEFFSYEECVPNKINLKEGYYLTLIHSGGRMTFFENEKILFTTGYLGHYLLSQEMNSMFGKIISIDLNTKEHEVVAMGTRNAQGLYYDQNKKVIIHTEHGPKGGEEININLNPDNKIVENFGWPISSYGLPREKEDWLKKNLPKKNHKDFGFIEPIKYWIPSTPIGQIIKIPKSFNEKFTNDFFVGFLGWKYHTSNEIQNILHIRFNESYDEILFEETIPIGERVRDLIFLESEKKVLMILESIPAIAVLK